MKPIKYFVSAGILALALATSAPVLAHGPIDHGGTAEEQVAYERDRKDILAMAGDFKVKFDMQESTSWRPGYKPLDAKISGGNESVRVIEDTGEKIVLQHLLVVDVEGKPYVIKHWRQDWQYRPAKLLAYSAPNTWTWEEVPERMRSGRWSQTVYQVDDSPRYASYGQFEEQGGVRRWRSNWTWRPLARRDAVRHPVYDRYLGINRHQVTPDGWIHWQDNTKMEGADKPVVQEYVLNTYTRFSDYDTKAADDYWAATKGYWDALRTEWDKLAETRGGLRVEEEAEAGTVIAGRLLEIADEIQSGKTKQADGLKQARALMTQYVSAPGRPAAQSAAAGL